MKLYLGNLAWVCTEQDIDGFFYMYGVKMGTSRIIKDRESGQSKGYGFVEVERGEDAIRDLNGKDLVGRPVRVSEANQQGAPRRTNR